VFKTLLGLLC